MQAIFSGGSQRKGRTHARFSSYELEDETEPNSSIDHVSSKQNLSRKHGHDSLFRISKIFVVLFLTGIMLTIIVGFGGVNSGIQHHTDGGTSGTGTNPPVKTPAVRIIAPIFQAVSDIPEAIVPINQSYTGTTGAGADDFIIVQVAYSEGSPGNLPDISNVGDTQSTSYARVASASPGVASNFWEQVWTSRSSLTTNSTITVSPDWAGCQMPCATSIIIAMTVGRYRGVAGVGASTAIAPSTSSSSQSVNIATTQANSMLVELLSHGAYSNCGIDAPQPGTGQTPRNCFTATTERTELFDHSISNAQTYTESYSWTQVEVQRGIYIELKGNSILV